MKRVVYLRFAKDRAIFIRLFSESFLFIGAAATVASSFIDYFLAPENIFPIAFARSLSVPIAALCWLIYERYPPKKLYQWPAFFTALYMGILHAYLVQHTGAAQSPYLIGLALASVSMIGILPWQSWQTHTVFSILWGPTTLVAIFQYDSLNKPYLYAALSMVVITYILSQKIFQNSQRLREKEFEQMLNLQIINRKQGEIIKEKTKEGIYLEKLSLQFSPQVIESIKSGEISLSGKNLQEVTCIFLDIEKSTQLAVALDSTSYTSLLEHFFGACIKVFLKHDVTVASYLGDGIMAISNAPTLDHRHREKAIAALLEILEMRQLNQEQYRTKWRSEINIRLGISTGLASVGFYPSESYGTYTALGETTNLAARLCSLAPVNSIATTEDFISTLKFSASSTADIRSMGQFGDIKGFEGKYFDLVALRPRLEAVSEACESCGVNMERISLQTELTPFIKCPVCNLRRLVRQDAFSELALPVERIAKAASQRG